MMQAIITDADRMILAIILKRFVFWKKAYINAGRVKMLEWYNGETKRNVCIRTLDYMIARLKNADMIVRKMRTKDAGVLGKQFDTSLTELTNRGLYEIRKLGVKAFEIMERIRSSPKKERKKPHTKETGRHGEGSTGQVGEVVREELKKLKPS